jgi:hypothetical protein
MRYVHSEKIGKPNNLQTLRSRTSKPNGLNMIAKVTDAWGRLTLVLINYNTKMAITINSFSFIVHWLDGICL